MIISMTPMVIILGLVLLGLIVGSFNGATVWRLRARQLKEDKDAGERINKTEYHHLKKLLGASVQNDRSICLHCHHQLAWYDLIPLLSWSLLGGKCRYCHHRIGRMEPLIELGTAVFFVASYLFWPMPLHTALEAVELGIWLLLGSGLIILLAYDSRWFLLPDRVVLPLVAVALVGALLRLSQSHNWLMDSASMVLGVIILSGLYYVLYVVSHGRWIGFGDVKLGLVLALGLGSWPLAFLALFFANVIGCAIVLPGLVAGKLSRTSHVPFGPMLIIGYFIVGLFGQTILLWYLGDLSL